MLALLRVSDGVAREPRGVRAAVFAKGGGLKPKKKAAAKKAPVKKAAAKKAAVKKPAAKKPAVKKTSVE